MSDLDISYGGQAVIGGVLIQSPKGWSLGVRAVSYTHLTLPTKA